MRTQIREKIQQLRICVAMHAFIYYELGLSDVTDQQWQQWADRLVELHEQYPDYSDAYDKYWNDFDGSTGYDLCQIPGLRNSALKYLECTTWTCKMNAIKFHKNYWTSFEVFCLNSTHGTVLLILRTFPDMHILTPEIINVWFTARACDPTPLSTPLLSCCMANHFTIGTMNIHSCWSIWLTLG